jgi:hypothetical protein
MLWITKFRATWQDSLLQYATPVYQSREPLIENDLSAMDTVRLQCKLEEKN